MGGVGGPSFQLPNQALPSFPFLPLSSLFLSGSSSLNHSAILAPEAGAGPLPQPLHSQAGRGNVGGASSSGPSSLLESIRETEMSMRPRGWGREEKRRKWAAAPSVHPVPIPKVL